MNFRQLDLNLLRVLVAIHHSGSVTAASKALALSQPATSNALARLRRYFDDELFVRSPSGLRPTRLCEQLAPAIQQQLLAMQGLLSQQQPFDASQTPMHWRLSLSDLGEILFMPRIAQALSQAAPQAQVSNVAVAAEQVSGALEARDIDLAIGILQAQHRAIRRERLFVEHFMAVTPPDWRPAKGRRHVPLTPEQLAQSRFVVVSPQATFHGSVETMLERMHLSDRIALRTRHFGAVFDIVHKADLVAIVPEMYALNLAERQGLQVHRIHNAPSYEVHLLWHSSTDRDPAHQWMRQLLKQLFSRSVPRG